MPYLGRHSCLLSLLILALCFSSPLSFYLHISTFTSSPLPLSLRSSILPVAPPLMASSSFRLLGDSVHTSEVRGREVNCHEQMTTPQRVFKPVISYRESAWASICSSGNNPDVIVFLNWTCWINLNPSLCFFLYFALFEEVWSNVKCYPFPSYSIFSSTSLSYHQHNGSTITSASLSEFIFF